MKKKKGQRTGRARGAQGGFTILECLLAMTIFSVIVLAGFECFGTARRLFSKLRSAQDDRLDVLIALDKIRADVQAAGAGLAVPAALGLIFPVAEDAGELRLASAEKSLAIPDGLARGQTEIPLSDARGLAAGRTVCVCGGMKGLLARITSIDGSVVRISPPLTHSFGAGEASLLLVQEVALFLDPETAVLRRRVNASSAQPLLEGAGSFSFSIEPLSSLTRVRLVLSSQETTYEIAILPKNALFALAPPGS